MIQKSNVMLDPHQLRALKELDRLRNDVLSSPQYNATNEETKAPASRTFFIRDGEDSDSTYKNASIMDKLLQNTLFRTTTTRIRDGGTMVNKIFGNTTTKISSNPRMIKGVYLHGGVGCGKTFCMNLFYNHLPITASKQQVHFHKFMLDVHKQMHEAKIDTWDKR
jgi:Predicted ATPase